jgi:hypothetical protein
MIGDQMKRLLGALAAVGVALTALVGVQPASAATSCEDARRVAIADALGIGDVSLAAKALSMCSNPCESISAFYKLPNLSSYVESLVLAAYKTCLAANSGSGGNSGGEQTTCKLRTFSQHGKPKITGVRETGNVLSVSEASFDIFSPDPENIDVKYYRNGKEIPYFDGLGNNDVGKRFSVKLIASRQCFKPSVAWSAPTSAIAKSTLPKLKLSDFKITLAQSEQEFSTSTLEIVSNYSFGLTSATWTWVGAPNIKLAKEFSSKAAGGEQAYLPTKLFRNKWGELSRGCLNGKVYKIGVTATISVYKKFAPTKLTWPAKPYVCKSHNNG